MSLVMARGPLTGVATVPLACSDPLVPISTAPVPHLSWACWSDADRRKGSVSETSLPDGWQTVR